MQTKLFLIDAMALAYRCFYALMGQGGLTTSKGIPVSVPYASAQFIRKLITEQQPDYLALVGESPTTKTFRHEIYPNYKKKRATLPDMMQQQLPLFYELFDCLDIKRLEVEGYEADDVIGTLAKRFTEVKVYIVSHDKDFMQLVGGNTYIFSKDYRILGVEAVREKFACEPEQVVDYLALVGDPSDNVPGVKGIGHKTASQLISDFGSLNGIYNNLDQISSLAMQKKLLEGRDDAYLSQRLVTIDTNVSLTTKLDELRYQQSDLSDNQLLRDFYQRLEFNKFLGENFSKPIISFVSSDYAGVLRRVNTIEEMQDCLGKLSSLTEVIIEIIPTHEDLVTAGPKQIIIGDQQVLWLIDMVEFGGYRYPLSHFFNNPDLTKIGYDLKNIIKVLNNIDIAVAGELRDVMIYDYLLNPNASDHNLSSICQRYLTGRPNLADVEVRVLLINKLAEVLAGEVAAQGMETLARDLEMPLIHVLAEMEGSGIYIDIDLLRIFERQLSGELSRIELTIYQYADKQFNINSPKQLQSVLFDELRVHEELGIKKAIPRTKSGYSTNENVLQMLKEHPMVKVLLRYRELSKIKNTYVDALPRYVRRNGCLYGNFRQDVVATGRLSSDNPNLQNIPMRSLHGKKIRCAFKARSIDNVIVSADYSQIEIRLLACLAKADSLIEAFNAGVDIHRLTAAKIVGVDSEQVTDEQRSQAKAINFGIIYGMGARKLSTVIDVSVNEAQKFINRYFDAYPEIRVFTDKLIQQAMNKGYSETPLGRRRQIMGINDSNPTVSARARNMAINSCIQGYAADLIKLAMIKVLEVFKKKKLTSKLVLQVHDELVFETPREELVDTCQEIKTAMEQVIVSDVVLPVDVKYGANWLEQLDLDTIDDE